MGKRKKKTKGKTMIYKTLQRIPKWKPGMNTDTSEGLAFPAALGTPFA